jgi:hypothetical protein
MSTQAPKAAANQTKQLSKADLEQALQKLQDLQRQGQAARDALHSKDPKHASLKAGSAEHVASLAAHLQGGNFAGVFGNVIGNIIGVIGSIQAVLSNSNLAGILGMIPTVGPFLSMFITIINLVPASQLSALQGVMDTLFQQFQDRIQSAIQQVEAQLAHTT